MQSSNLEWGTEPLNFNLLSLPVEAVLVLLFEEFNLALCEVPVMASPEVIAFPEVIALQDN